MGLVQAAAVAVANGHQDSTAPGWHGQAPPPPLMEQPYPSMPVPNGSYYPPGMYQPQGHPGFNGQAMPMPVDGQGRAGPGRVPPGGYRRRNQSQHGSATGSAVQSGPGRLGITLK